MSLNAWLAEANEGDKIELNDDSGRVSILEATRVAGTMILKDLSVIEDLERENLILRHEISRRIFSPFPTPLKILRKYCEAVPDMLYSKLQTQFISVLRSNTLKRKRGCL